MREDPFETCDLFLTAYLLASGHRLQGVGREDPRRLAFRLEPHPTTQELAAYADGSAVVNVQAFVRAERQLKREMRVSVRPAIMG